MRRSENGARRRPSTPNEHPRERARKSHSRDRDRQAESRRAHKKSSKRDRHDRRRSDASSSSKKTTPEAENVTGTLRDIQQLQKKVKPEPVSDDDPRSVVVPPVPSAPPADPSTARSRSSSVEILDFKPCPKKLRREMARKGRESAEVPPKDETASASSSHQNLLPPPPPPPTMPSIGSDVTFHPPTMTSSTSMGTAPWMNGLGSLEERLAEAQRNPQLHREPSINIDNFMKNEVNNGVNANGVDMEIASNPSLPTPSGASSDPISPSPPFTLLNERTATGIDIANQSAGYGLTEHVHNPRPFDNWVSSSDPYQSHPQNMQQPQHSEHQAPYSHLQGYQQQSQQTTQGPSRDGVDWFPSSHPQLQPAYQHGQPTGPYSSVNEHHPPMGVHPPPSGPSPSSYPFALPTGAPVSSHPSAGTPDAHTPTGRPTTVHFAKPGCVNKYSQTGESLLLPCLKELKDRIDKYSKITSSAGELKAKDGNSAGPVDSREPSTSSAISAHNDSECGDMDTDIGSMRFLRSDRDRFSQSHYASGCHYYAPESLLWTDKALEASIPIVMGDYQWTLLFRLEHKPGFEVVRVGLRCSSRVLCNAWKLRVSIRFWLDEFVNGDPNKARMRHLLTTFTADSPEQWLDSEACTKLFVLKKHYKDLEGLVHQHFSVDVLLDGCREIGAENSFRRKKSSLFCDSILYLGPERTPLYVNRSILCMYSSLMEEKLVHCEDHWEYSDASVNANQFEELLRVIYPEQKPITDQTVVSLMELAAHFEFLGVMSKCEEHLMGQKTQMSVLLRLDMASGFMLSRLQKHCLNSLSSLESASRLKDDPQYPQLGQKAKLILLDKIMKLASGST